MIQTASTWAAPFLFPLLPLYDPPPPTSYVRIPLTDWARFFFQRGFLTLTQKGQPDIHMILRIFSRAVETAFFISLVSRTYIMKARDLYILARGTCLCAANNWVVPRILPEQCGLHGVSAIASQHHPQRHSRLRPRKHSPPGRRASDRQRRLLW